MIFDKNFFSKQKFTGEELKKYKRSAKRDLDIAKTSKEPEVVFHFAYMALIKIGIYCLASEGYRVKGRPGHHQMLIEFLSRHFKSEDILIVGDKMRKDRNLDFYSADALGPHEEIAENLKFVNDLYNKL